MSLVCVSAFAYILWSERSTKLPLATRLMFYRWPQYVGICPVSVRMGGGFRSSVSFRIRVHTCMRVRVLLRLAFSPRDLRSLNVQVSNTYIHSVFSNINIFLALSQKHFLLSIVFHKSQLRPSG